MVEAQAEVLHRPYRNRVIALAVRQHHRLLTQAADGQNRRLRLIDDRRPKLLAENPGVGQRERGPRSLVGQQLFGACASREIRDCPRQA